MASKINFEMESLEALKAETASLKENLTDINTRLREKMDELKEDWKTPAGIDFFENQKTNWDPEIKNYINILETLEKMIGEAIQKYEDVEREANRLSI